MNIACPECQTVYRVDPSRVPERGISAQCRECDSTFRVEADTSRSPGEVTTAAAVAAGGIAATTPAPEQTPSDFTAPVETSAAGEAPAETAAPASESLPSTGPSAETAPGGDGGGGTDSVTEQEGPGRGTRPAAPAFGPQDPQTRARRLARALVSDIKVYNQEKWEQSRAAGTLRTQFRDEVLKSWEEYVEQVGEEMAKKTPYFRDALNDILAAGTRVF